MSFEGDAVCEGSASGPPSPLSPLEATAQRALPASSSSPLALPPKSLRSQPESPGASGEDPVRFSHNRRYKDSVPGSLICEPPPSTGALRPAARGSASTRPPQHPRKRHLHALVHRRPNCLVPYRSICERFPTSCLSHVPTHKAASISLLP